jgi:hypothetical protein
MDSHSQALVHDLLAFHLRLDPDLIRDADDFVELDLEPLDLVLVVLRLEALCGREGDFPLVDLADARTVGDFVTLVDSWLRREAPSAPAVGTAPRRSSAA